METKNHGLCEIKGSTINKGERNLKICRTNPSMSTKMMEHENTSESSEHVGKVVMTIDYDKLIK